MSKVNAYHPGANAPLNKLDTEKQTYGCRCYNPDICKNGNGENCALTNKTHICTTPPQGWTKRYKELKEKEKNL